MASGSSSSWTRLTRYSGVASHLLGSADLSRRVSLAAPYVWRVWLILPASFVGARLRKSPLTALAASVRCVVLAYG